MSAPVTPGKSFRPRWASQKQISRPCGIALKMTATEHYSLVGLYESLSNWKKDIYRNSCIAILPYKEKRTLLLQGVCVKHLNRCKTSNFAVTLVSFFALHKNFGISLYTFAGGTWSMDRSGANEDTYPMLVISRLITVTYLLIFSDIARG